MNVFSLSSVTKPEYFQAQRSQQYATPVSHVEGCWERYSDRFKLFKSLNLISGEAVQPQIQYRYPPVMAVTSADPSLALPPDALQEENELRDLR